MRRKEFPAALISNPVFSRKLLHSKVVNIFPSASSRVTANLCVWQIWWPRLVTIHYGPQALPTPCFESKRILKKQKNRWAIISIYSTLNPKHWKKHVCQCSFSWWKRSTCIEETVANILLSNLSVIGSFNIPFPWSLHLGKWKGQLNITRQLQY